MASGKNLVNEIQQLTLTYSYQTPPTPEGQTPIKERSSQTANLSFASAYGCNSALDMPMPSPVPVHQQKWIHRRLWARENNEAEPRRNLFLSSVIPRSRSKIDESVPSSLPGCPEKQDPVVLIQASRRPGGLARSPSVSTSFTSTMSSHTSTKCQLTPKKSILSTRSSGMMKHSKHGRSRSGSTQSVKFADAPTYYYDNEYKYAYDEGSEDEDEEYDSPTTSTTPCIPPFSPTRKGTARTSPSIVRQALDRFIPFTRRPSERPSISGPYPLCKDKDGDGGSVRSIPFSVRSAPASRRKVRSFWGRMITCTTR